MMKISILLPDFRGGGVERIRIVLAHEFARIGHDVEFVVMQAKGELLDEARASFNVVDLGINRARRLPIALVKYLRQRNVDALLAAMYPLTVIAPFAARLSGQSCKVLISEHNTLSAQYASWGNGHRAIMRASMALGYRLADSRVGVSLGVVKDLARLSGLRINNFEVIHNPLSLRSAATDNHIKHAEKFWSVPKGARIVTVGSMKAQKNHCLLLRAFARLDRVNAQLMFVGDGARRGALLLLAKELGIANRVILAGFHRDPTPFYRTADLFVLSSDYEGFGNVVVEALANGTPVVSTDCPSGPAEILQGGRFGHLVPVGDVDALVQAMGSALYKPIDHDTLVRRASDFSPEISAKKYLELLHSGGRVGY